MGEVESFWSTYVAAEREWIGRRAGMEESAWIEEAGDALWDLSSMGTAPFEAATVEGYSGRPLFRVRTYAHPNFGRLHRVFTASDQTGDTWPSRQYLVTTKGALKLMAEYATCRTCRGAGKAGGRKCGDCGGQGVMPLSSSCRVFATLGSLASETVVEAHPDLDDLADW